MPVKRCRSYTANPMIYCDYQAIPAQTVPVEVSNLSEKIESSTERGWLEFD